MITVFTIPKPFVGHIGLIQRNAIRSWKAVGITKIFLFGNETGVAEAAIEHNVNHVSFVERNDFGTPLLSSVFAAAERLAQTSLLMYVNADIILTHPIESLLVKVDLANFLLSGRRWDLDVRRLIDFEKAEWSSILRSELSSQGIMHGFSGKDYFIFPRGWVKMPAFAVGRPGWDDWFIYDARTKKIPVIDATEAITIIHQNHDYSHSPYGEQLRVGGPEQRQNVVAAGGFSNGMTLREATLILTPEGLIKPRFPQCIFSYLADYKLWRFLLGLFRIIRRRLSE